MKTSSHHQPTRQRGATLIVALLLLVSIAMLGIWAFNSSTTNMRIVGNMQVRQEASDAVQAAVERTISSPLFIEKPAEVAATPVVVGINGVDYSVWLKDDNGQRTPACFRVKVIKQNELDPAVKGDRDCMEDGQTETDIESDVPPVVNTAGDSMCSDSEWNVYAQVKDNQTGAFVAVNQGVGARVLTTAADSACPAS